MLEYIWSWLSRREISFSLPLLWSCKWTFLCSSVTTPGTEAAETQKATAVPGSLCKTPEDISTPPEEAKPCLQTPATSERSSPIVQEPEEAPEPKEESSPRKTSLVIVESADDQPQVLERRDDDDDDVAFQKVRLSSLLCPSSPVPKFQSFLASVSVDGSFYFSIFTLKLKRLIR